MKYILLILGICFSFSSIAEHRTLDNEVKLKNNKNLVQEIFYFACDHCEKIEKPLQEWSEKVKNTIIVEKVPVVLSSKQRLAAKHYYSSQYLSIENEFLEKYFEGMSEGLIISDSLAIEIMKNLGEKEEKIIEAFNSNWVEQKVIKARELTLRMKINTVPTFLINDKYIVKRSSFDKDENLFNYIEKLSK
jgi:thiol:disulfide interchange protein DsbA